MEWGCRSDVDRGGPRGVLMGLDLLDADVVDAAPSDTPLKLRPVIEDLGTT